MSDYFIVGYLPRYIHVSTNSNSFFQKNGHIILVQVTGRRRSTDLQQGRLEVPGLLMLVGERKDLLKVCWLMEAAATVPSTLPLVSEVNPSENELGDIEPPKTT